MNTSLLEKQFQEMGARFKIEPIHWFQPRANALGFSVNILEDRKGEYFSLQLGDRNDLDISVVDLRRDARHLLLMISESDGSQTQKHKFLCGHDERHWFVAAVPNRRGVKDVASAMEALKPGIVRQQQVRKRLKRRQWQRRKNKVYIRQGEWFFIPVENFNPPNSAILKNEPISRGNGGKPHICEFVYRAGGETVYVNSEFPGGLTEAEYNALCNRNPKYRKRHWKVMVRNAGVYAKGRVSHSDHATILLPGWHQVEMNLEFQAASMKNLAFLD